MTKDKTPDGNVLSVIVPVYNAKDTIKECVDSILAQKCGKQLEILLMDDGSTDGSAEIGRPMRETPERRIWRRTA